MVERKVYEYTINLEPPKPPDTKPTKPRVRKVEEKKEEIPVEKIEIKDIATLLLYLLMNYEIEIKVRIIERKD